MATTLTPTQHDTLYTLYRTRLAQYVEPADRVRVERGYGLALTVERDATVRDLWLVPSENDPDRMYTVYRGACDCPDAARRDARGCKHAHATALYQQYERLEVERAEPITIIVEPEDESIPLWPTRRPITVLPLPAELAALDEELFGPRDEVL